MKVIGKVSYAMGVALWAVAPWVAAQTPAGLSIQINAGLTITGSVGTVYSIEYATDLAETNSPAAWRCLEFLQLPVSPYLWAEKSAPATGKRFYRALAFTAPTNMVFIPPGTFRMGSPTNEVDRFDAEGPQTQVTISRGFWMGKYEVTQLEYESVTGSNPSYYAGDPSRPVESVGPGVGLTRYMEPLTRLARAVGRIPTKCVYRRPTEAEWEYACRGWTSTRFSYGDDFGYTNLTDYSWYRENSGGTTHPVGQKLPNPWGLYDMHGNVAEWCQDWWASDDLASERLPGGITIDTQGASVGWYRAFRGGGLSSLAGECRAAVRVPSVIPGGMFDQIGFRVVLAPEL